MKINPAPKCDRLMLSAHKLFLAPFRQKTFWCGVKSIVISIVLSALIITPTLAIDLTGGLLKEAAGKAGYSQSTTNLTLAETIGLVVKAALSFAGAIFLVLMVYAGYLWMTARGEEEQIKKAQKIIFSSIIGLVITVSAYSITAFIVPLILERTASGSVIQ